MGVSIDEAIWAYRVVLGRDPESYAIIDYVRNNHSDINHLREELLSSNEYTSKNPGRIAAQDFFRDVEVLASLDRYGVDGKIYVNLSDAVGRLVALGAYENGEIEFLKSQLREGDTFLDIGGNVGAFAIIGSQLVGPTGKVFTFEALSPNADSIRRSVGENQFASNIELIQAIVSDRPSDNAFLVYQSLSEGSGNSGGASIYDGVEDLPPHLRKEKVRQDTLDNLLDAGTRVSFIKIDIEGAEALAFKGASRLLTQQSPVIMSEVHTSQLRKVSGMDWREYFGLMESFGYTARHLDEGKIGRAADDLEDGRIYNVVFSK